MPRNLVSQKAYRGCNAVWLMTRESECGYLDPRWGTFLQIKKAGGMVRKQERGTPVLFIKSHYVADPMADFLGEDSEVWQVVPKLRKQIQYWAEYRVFNVEQTIGLELSSIPAKRWRPHVQAENVIRGIDVPIVHSTRHTEATYYPGKDVIHVPPREIFPTADSYYRTLLHELAHATGHPSRMKRECMKDGTKKTLSKGEIAREELRAEICSMIVNTTLGIPHNPLHGTAYVKAWISALKDDPTEVYRATAEAQRMSDYLLSNSVNAESHDASTSRESDASGVDPQ